MSEQQKGLDDNYLVSIGLRAPKLLINPKRFEKTEKERAQLLTAKAREGKLRVLGGVVVSGEVYSAKKKRSKKPKKTRMSKW